MTAGSLAAALANRRFRWLLLALAAVPVTAVYAVRTLALPLTHVETQTDLYLFYLPPARALDRGLDPYASCGGSCFAQLTSSGSLYPPFVPWLFRPVAGVDFRIVDGVAVLLAAVCVAGVIAALAALLPDPDPQVAVLLAVAVLSYPPLLQLVHERQLHLLVVLACAVWAAMWVRGDRAWAGLLLGLATAAKLVCAPLLVLAAWGRRWLAGAVAVATWAVLWLVAEPRLLPEYLLRVLPGAGGGTGSAKNVAPVGSIARVLHPASFAGGDYTGVDSTVRVLAAAVALGVLVVTALCLGRAPRERAHGRALEAALVVAALPLVTPYVLPAHLAVELVPVAVLVTVACAARTPWPAVAAASGWVLTGPVYLAFTNAVDLTRVTALDRVWAESAVAGAVVLWATAALNLTKARPGIVDM